MKQPFAPKLIESVMFQSPSYTPDGSGGEDRVWVDHFKTRADYRFLRGGEAVIAGRLEGKQPVVITVRRCEETRAATNDWIIKDLRTLTIYNVRSVIPTKDRRFIELLCESGVAV